MCEISWASTPASSASLLMRPSAPRVMWTMPPGEANAFTPSVSRTMNSQFRSGRLLACVMTVPTRVMYVGHLFVLEHAELQSDPIADRFAERAFVLLRNVQLSDLLGLVDALHDLAELCVGRIRHHDHGDSHQKSLHSLASSIGSGIGEGTTISNIATGRVFPLTTTSPSGRISYLPLRRVRVASLIMIRVR